MRYLALAIACLATPALAADPVNIRPDLPSVTVETPDGPAVIAREQDPAAKLEGDWALTSRACPPFCVQPMQPAEGVRTIGELELLDMLADPDALVFDGFICEDVPEIALFCNGPWCGQSPTAIRRIIEAGFPAEKISYYRGGMQVWRMMGFTVTGAE